MVTTFASLGLEGRSLNAEAERMLTKRVVPKVGGMPVRNLTAERVRALHRSMRETPGAANRMLTALGAALAFGQREGLVSANSNNPCGHVHRSREEGSRRFLTREELGQLGTVLAEAATSGKVEIEDKAHKVHPSGVVYTVGMGPTNAYLSSAARMFRNSLGVGF